MPGSTDLTPSFYNAKWYRARNGKLVNFTWDSVPVEFNIPSGSYSPPAGDGILFSFIAAGPQNISPDGFVATEFGTPYLQYDRDVVVTGDVQTQFGDTFIRLQRRYVNAAGFSPSVHGVQYIYNRNRYVRPTGIAPANLFGSPIVQNRNIYPLGWKEADRFGLPFAYNKNRWINMSGISAQIIGAPKFENHKFTIDGLVHTVFGVPYLENKRKVITHPGYVATEWGDAWVSNEKRNVYGIGNYHGIFGTPLATHARVTPLGINTLAFGTPEISAKSQYVMMTGFMQRLFSNKNEFVLQHRKVKPVGEAHGVFGTPTVTPTYIHVTGISHPGWQYMGTPKVCGTRVTGLTWGVATKFGDSLVAYSPRYITDVTLGVETLFGSPPYGVMHKFDQYPNVVGFDSFLMGREEWDSRPGLHILEIDYAIDAGAGISTAFGTPQVTT